MHTQKHEEEEPQPLTPRGTEVEAEVVPPREAEFRARLAAFQKQTRWKRLPGMGMFGPGLAVGAVFGAVLVLIGEAPGLFGAALGLSVLAFLGFLYNMYRVVPKRYKSRDAAQSPAARLAELGDARALPPLLDFWITSTDLTLSYEVVPAVASLLPHLDAGNADALPAKTRRQMRQLVGLTGLAISGAQEPTYRKLYAGCMVALLDALARIGDTEAVSAVSALTKIRGDAEAVACVREAAKDCEAHLQGLLSREAMPQTLLRASDARDARPGELLRAAQGVSAPDAATLLRPGDSQG